jgi:two-component system NtrC family sensor kinase
LFAKRSIRVKLLVALGLLLSLVVILSSGSLYSTYTYRSVVADLSWRADELPLTSDLSRRVAELRMTLSELRGLRTATFPSPGAVRVFEQVQAIRDRFRAALDDVSDTATAYRELLEGEANAGSPMADNRREWRTLERFEAALERIRQQNRVQDWMLDEAMVVRLDAELETLQELCAELPSFLHAKMKGFRDDVRAQYRALIVGTWVTSALAAMVLGVLLRVFYRWVFWPLGVLIVGSRQVAAGNFDYRIHLQTHDEMAELAQAMNDMTARFQAIRDDLDRQVQERTKQVVRSEQLASVGFLAAGVAHEINNPLAAIAMAAESLEGRLADLLPPDATDRQVVLDYLKMIQSEAFRCKGITEKLLDFSRVGPVTRRDTDLAQLVQSVIEMVGTLGKYQRRAIQFQVSGPVVVSANPQEIKQVVLNLLANALDSTDEDGEVRVELSGRDGWAVLDVADNGCGMSAEVLQHVFEPFFTRRREGQGTGLGLSISYRIVADHGGTIEAHSDGPGRGATFRVRLPLIPAQKEVSYQHRAA